MPGACEHAATVKSPPPRTPEGCEECLRIGDAWVHLRLCEECGHVGCSHRVLSARRAVEVVLRGRNDVGVNAAWPARRREVGR
jgi:hypothetical protein